ncbi:unnamed protein product [Closterium sp. NIES-54]
MTRFHLLQRLCRRGSRRDFRFGGDVSGGWNRVIRAESTACTSGAATSASSAGFRGGCSTIRINGCDDGAGLIIGSGPSRWDHQHQAGLLNTIRFDLFPRVESSDRKSCDEPNIADPRQHRTTSLVSSAFHAASYALEGPSLRNTATAAFSDPQFHFSAPPPFSASSSTPLPPFRSASRSAPPHLAFFRSASATSAVPRSAPGSLALSAAGFHSSAAFANGAAIGGASGASASDESSSQNAASESVLSDAPLPSGADVSGAVLGDGAADVISAATSDVGLTVGSELAAAAAHCSAPIAALQQLIGAVHDVAGLPWWLSIAAATVGIRLILLPAFVYQVRSTVKMALIKPEMERLLNKVKAAGYDTEAVAHYNGKMQALLKKHNTTPFAPLLGIFLQAPIFIGFYFAITGMAEHMPSFTTGGAFWFTDLTTPDTTYLLPLMSSAGILAAVELNAAEGMEGAPNAAQMKWFMRGLAVTMVPLTVTFPKAVFCYWITTNVFSLVQGLGLKRPGVRKALGIPTLKPPSSNASPGATNLQLRLNVSPSFQCSRRRPSSLSRLSITTCQLGDSNEGGESIVARPFEAETEARAQAKLAASDPNRRYQEMMQRREESRQQTLREYGDLKRQLSQTAIGVGAAGTLYCFLGISIQTAISYGIGSAASCLYLLLLFNDTDTVAPEDLPPAFLIDRNKPKRKGLVDSLATVDSPQKLVQGAQLALSSRRLLVPAALVLLWSFSLQFSGSDPNSLHIEFAPLFIGFLSYKIAVLLFTIEDVTNRIPPDPPEPPQPPAPPAPPAPPVPPTPPAPPPPVPPVPPCPVAPHIDNHRVLTLLLPSAFDEYLSEPDYDKDPDVDVPAPAPAPRWGQPEDFMWDESAVGADDDVQDAEEGWRAEGDAGAEGGTEADTEAATEAGTAEDVFPEGAPGGDDDDAVEYWSRDGLPEKLPIPTYPPRNRKRPHPSSQNRDSRPPSPRHKPNDHKRHAYTAAEKLKWVMQLDVAVSVRALARESGIHRKCLANWKRAADFLKEAHSARCHMHGRGRASWYRPMEIKVYERLLDWRRKGTAVSVGRLQEWSREFMKILYPLVKWKGSQRWSDRFHVAEQCKNFWQFVHYKRRERGIETTWIINADQTSLWLEMPATTTVDQTGVRSVPIRSAGYQKERVTVMLACTADGMKLRPWVFFKRKTVPKGVFPSVPADLIKRTFLTCGITNALNGSEDGLAMAHRRSQLAAEVDVDDSIIADGFFGNNCQEPESDEE